MKVSKDDPRPPYAQLAADLRRAVETGKYRPGQRLPTVRELAEQYEVSRNTIQRALDTLKVEGVVVSRPPLGVFARSDDAEEKRSPEFVELMRLLDDLRESIRSLDARLAEVERRVPRGRQASRQ